MRRGERSSKAALRARFKTRRAAINPADREIAGHRLTRTVIGYEPFAEARTVALFASYRDEIPTDSLVEAMRRAGRQVLLPRVDAVGHEMVLCTFSSLADLARDRFGIRSPDGPVFTGLVDLVYVPGLAFGRDGSRLGYGGGFYDRLLGRADFAGVIRCGLGFAEQVVDKLPMEARDSRLTHIATPERVLTVPA